MLATENFLERNPANLLHKIRDFLSLLTPSFKKKNRKSDCWFDRRDPRELKVDLYIKHANEKKNPSSKKAAYQSFFKKKILTVPRSEYMNLLGHSAGQLPGEGYR